jgi:hypothetical protein
MSIALVQHTQKNQSTAVTSTTLAYASNVTAGDLLICVVRGGTPLTSITITDSQGNTWTNCTFQNVNGAGSLQISFAVANATGGNTVTITPNASTTLRIAILEYSGTDTSSPLDAENNSSTGTSTAPAASSITPAAANELVIGAVAVGNAENFSPGASFTLEEQVPTGASGKMAVEDWIQTTATATTAPQTINVSDTWLAAIAVFKPAGSAAIPPVSAWQPPPAPPAVPTPNAVSY